MTFLLIAWGVFLGFRPAPPEAPAAEQDPGPEWVEPVDKPKNSEDEMADPTSPIVGAEPKVIHVSPEAVLKQIADYMAQMPQVACVILIGPRGDPAHVACQTNVGRNATRDMLRTARNGMDSGRIAVPG